MTTNSRLVDDVLLEVDVPQPNTLGLVTQMRHLQAVVLGSEYAPRLAVIREMMCEHAELRLGCAGYERKRIKSQNKKKSRESERHIARGIPLIDP